MPAGLPYFAWIDSTETVFGAEHMRWDEAVFSFTLKQDEGDPASMTVLVRRPVNDTGDAIGLLGPGRKIWAWFAFDCGPALIKFRGRLVGIPTSIFEELVTLEFVARPFDYVAQKAALAETLKVLPYYDEAVIDPARSTDPDVVLEGYTKIWHYDRETHVITVSDEISGEDGLVEFLCANGDVLYDGLGLTLNSGPLARVDVSAEYTWTQQARGTVDLTRYLLSHWPAPSGAIVTYTLAASDWPKHGTGIGDGWEVAESSAYDAYDYTVHSKTAGSTLAVNFAEGDSSNTTFSETTSYCNAPVGIPLGTIITGDDITTNYSHDGDGLLYTSSFSRNFSSVTSYIPIQAINGVSLVAGYTAGRTYTERVSFSLFADVQPILTDPEDGEALRIDNVKSVNLTEGGMIGDPRRRSYIATARGNQSLEHLIALARANLMKRARVVEIAFVPKLARMPEISLRKNVFLIEPRVGEATGKIIGYSLGLDGNDGQIKCEVKIGCTIGRGGSALATDGTPTYCTVDYAGSDYQQFSERVVLFDLVDTSVGYQPPGANPNDDGVDFLSPLRAEDVIESGLVVEFGPDEQEAALNDNIVQGHGAATVAPAGSDFTERQQAAVAARAEYAKNQLKKLETRATFKLKSMTREFSSDYELQVTDLKIPTGYNLEAV